MRICTHPVLYGVGGSEEDVATLGSPKPGPFASLGLGAGSRARLGRTYRRGARASRRQRLPGCGCCRSPESAADPPCARAGAEPCAPALPAVPVMTVLMACRGRGLGTPSGPAPNWLRDDQIWSVCAPARGGKKPSHSLTYTSCSSGL